MTEYEDKNWIEEQKSGKLKLILALAFAILIFFTFFRLFVVVNYEITIMDFIGALLLSTMFYVLIAKENSYNVVSIIFIILIFAIASLGNMNVVEYGSRAMWFASIVVAAFYWTTFFVLGAVTSDFLKDGVLTSTNLVAYMTVTINIIIIAIILSWYESIKQREQENYQRQQKKQLPKLEKKIVS